MERIAIIGSGIAGLAAARELTRRSGSRRVTLFEAAGHFGGIFKQHWLLLSGAILELGLIVWLFALRTKRKSAKSSLKDTADEK